MINIVMTVRDRYQLTKQSIESLFTNTIGDDYNLVIVDDGSTDFRLLRLLDDVALKPNASVLYVANSNHKLSHLKNLGVAYSRMRFGAGDWLYLSDNDVYFTDGWNTRMLEMARLVESMGFALFGGQSHPFHKPLNGKDGASFTEHDCLAGTSWMLRWSAWDTVGGLSLDTAPGVCQSEDFAFTEHLRLDCGGRIAVCNPFVVYDCGITNSNGDPTPGHEHKRDFLFHKAKAGIYYE